VSSRGFRAGLTALVIASGIAMSGCGIIGNPLADKAKPASAVSSPAASPSPDVPSVPEAGQCHSNNFVYQTSMVDDTVVPCTESHLAETAYVGRFVGDADPVNAPLLVDDATGTAAKIQNDAYLDCSAHTDEYLGHSWIHPLVALRIVMPDDRSWRAGDRWYRCDLYELDWLSSAVMHRTDSLKTKWFGATCFDLNGSVRIKVECAKKHPSEYVGGFMFPATLKKEPKTDKQMDPYYEKCWKIVAAYAGVTTSKAKSLVGVYLWWQYGDEYWASGRRNAWCFTWTGEKTSSFVTGSAKGRKGKGL
jgi:putative regulator of septum formation